MTTTDHAARLTIDGRNPFDDAVRDATGDDLYAESVGTFQVNIGLTCNLACHHCHVESSPKRDEQMTRRTMEQVLGAIDRAGATTLDITGGAPEMNPCFRPLVEGARRLDRRVIDRCNLTILESPGFGALAEFLADQRVEVVASLPCYLEENVDRQRGQSVFRKSIAALRRLNALGYGRPGSGLPLDLVYNPLGPKLPPDQAELEAAYRQQLRQRHGIEFTRLYALTNMPISRFLEDLRQAGEDERYMKLLVESFSPTTIDGLMCRSMLSVDWRGYLYDCDFDQMLDLGVAAGMPRHVAEVTPANWPALTRRRVVTGRHCYGCTAGAGSSCQGSLRDADQGAE